jgi:para-nitrobenzyl esterase
VAACLRAKPAGDLLAKSGTSVTNLTLQWAPAVGGSILPEQVQTAFEQGHYAHVPIVQGSNHDEGTLFVALGYGLGLGVTPANYPDLIAQNYGAAANQVLAEYPLAHYPSAPEALAATITDSEFSCPAFESNRALARRTPTYAYEFDDPNAALIIPLPTTFPTRSAHASEIPYVLGKTVALKLPPLFSPAQQRLSTAMMAYWSSFAHTGVPAAPGVTRWAPTAPDPYLVQRLNPESIAPIASFAADHHCGFWHQLAGQGLLPAT